MTIKIMEITYRLIVMFSCKALVSKMTSTKHYIRHRKYHHDNDGIACWKTMARRLAFSELSVQNWRKS